ncbi:MAG: DUF2975 domain-containing protein [Eubacteriales bacterium]|nr:DUF2975 domain-containing protein [Eubacteriales bacterium]
MDRVNNSKNIVKARCETIGTFLRVVFWIYTAALVGAIVYGIWMLTRDASCFTVNLIDTSDGLMGFAFFEDGFTIEFARNSLHAAAVQFPKLTYIIGYWVEIFVCILSYGILWNVKHIFRDIDREDTPFTQQNAKAIHRAGWLYIAITLVKSWLLPFLCGIAGIGTFSMTVYVNSLILGAVIICLSHVFAYGTVLQKESDETI